MKVISNKYKLLKFKHSGNFNACVMSLERCSNIFINSEIWRAGKHLYESVLLTVVILLFFPPEVTYCKVSSIIKGVVFFL